jgi:hypothetical protein
MFAPRDSSQYQPVQPEPQRKTASGEAPSAVFGEIAPAGKTGRQHGGQRYADPPDVTDTRDSRMPIEMI